MKSKFSDAYTLYAELRILMRQNYVLRSKYPELKIVYLFLWEMDIYFFWSKFSM